MKPFQRKKSEDLSNNSIANTGVGSQDKIVDNNDDSVV